MDSYTYITSHFLTYEELEKRSGFDRSHIDAMIEAGCLPGPAYKIQASLSISSFFGEYPESEEVLYFPESHVAKIKSIGAMEPPLEDMAKLLRHEFEEIYRAILEQQQAYQYGLGNLFSKHNIVEGSAAETFLDSEWRHYLDGTYGVCTRSASFEEIALKEVMIAKIKTLTARIEQAATGSLLKALREAVGQLDNVSAPFAPHEVTRSSRGKWIDAVREQYL